MTVLKTDPSSVALRKIGALLLLLLILNVISPTVVAGTVLNSAAEPDYPPLSIKDDQGRANGFAVGLLRAATKAMDMEINFKLGPWSEIKQELASDQLDVLPLVGRTPDREALFDFTVPYLSLYGSIVVKKGNNSVYGPKDLGSFKIGVMAGDNAEEYMRRHGHTQNLVTTGSYVDAFHQLQDGRLDAVVVQGIVAHDLIHQLGVDEFEIRAKLGDFRQDFCFAVTEGDKELLAVLNEGLSRVVADGTYTRLKQKWFGHYHPDEFRTPKRSTQVQLTDAEARWIKDHTLVAFTGDPNWLPYEAFLEDGSYIGIVADHLKLIEGQTGLKFKPIPVASWTESLRMATEGKVSVISGDAADAILNKGFNPVDIYSQNPIVIIMNSQQNYVERLEKIKGRKIAIIKDYGYTADIYRQYPGFNFVEVENIQQGLEGVSQGKLDAMLATMALASYHIADMGIHNIKVVGKTLIIMDLTLFVSKDQPLLHSIINKTLKSVSKATSQDILQSWIRSKYVEKTDYWLVLQVGLVLLLLLAVILVWNRRLRQEIETRQKAELAVLEQGEQIEDLLHSTAEAIYGLDQHGNCTFANKACVQILGNQSVDELIGRNMHDLIHHNRPDGSTYPTDECPIIRAALSGEGAHVDSEVLWRADGSCFPAEYWSYPIRRNGELTGAVVTFLDITERKQQADLMLLQARRAEALLELPPAAEQLDETSFAQRGLELAEELTGSKISFLHFVDNDEVTIKLVTWSRRTLKEYCQAVYDDHYQADQAGIWVDAIYQHKPVVFNDYLNHPHKRGLPEGHAELNRLISLPVIENGKVVMLSGVGNKETEYTDLDVETMQLIANEIWRILQRRRSLNEITRFNQVLEQSNNEIYIFDSETLHFVDVNLCARTNLGYSIGELRDLTPLDLNPEFTANSFTKLIEPLRLGAMEKIQYATLHHRKDGTTYPVEVHLQYMDEHPPVFAAIILDITERGRAEAEQARLQRELQQARKMEALGQLTGGIAHDFNNILGIILGYTDFALNLCDHDGQTKQTEYLNHVKNAGERATGLVTQMLAYSRDEARDDKPLQLQSLLVEDIRMLRSTLPASIEISTEIDDGLPPVLMDQVQFNQIMMNLSINARDAMEGKGKITVGLGWAKGTHAECTVCRKLVRGDWIELSVTDTGSGIKPDVLERIFDPFFTTKDVGKGTGMGLSVTHGIIHSHDGHIMVNTEIGIGSTFRLLFPPITQET
ncbi:MAG: transporter substrate-binding domain-containing protein, partial [Gammaproteobacteria bacterium]|nr:transporter substrate-binding domain-containing protein [Gammaproteobacteria bacterium]